MAGAGRRNHQTERITQVDEQILEDLYALHYLTVEQITRLHYSPRSITYVREEAKSLHDRRLVDWTFGPRRGPGGQAKRVYYLSKKGTAYLREAGFDFELRHRPSEGPGDHFLFHTLAVNDVVIAAKLLKKQVGNVELVAFQHDLDLKRRAVKLPIGRVDTTTGEKEQESISPDGWLCFEAHAPGAEKPEPIPLLLELDRNTESVRRVKRKMRGLMAYIREAYPILFGTTAVTVVFVVEEAACRTPEQARRRREELVRWIGEQLKDMGKESWAGTFLVTILPKPTELDPADFFLSAQALSPFQNMPISLLDLPETLRIGQPSETSKPLGVSIP